jgi:hypothetical protein
LFRAVSVAAQYLKGGEFRVSGAPFFLTKDLPKFVSLIKPHNCINIFVVIIFEKISQKCLQIKK